MGAIGTTSASTSGVGDTTPDQEIDPATGLPKPKTNAQTNAAQLPTQQVNNNDNIIPLTPAASNPASYPPTNTTQPAAAQAPATPGTQTITDTAQGNDAVLLAAQNQAVNQGTNPLTGLITQDTASYLQDPNLGFNYQKYNQSALEDYDRQQSAAMEAARTKLGATSQSGELQNQFLQNQMQSAAGHQDLAVKNDYAAAQAEQANMVAALAAGRAGQAGNDASSTSQINNDIAVRGAYEGERSQSAAFQDNVALTNLGFDHQTQLNAQQHGYDLETMGKQFGNDMAKLMANNDFTGAQNQLNRDATAAIDANDTGATAANLQKQLDFNKWAQENGQTFTAAQNAINNALQVSLKTLDIQGQKDLATLNGQIQSNQLMTQDDFKASEDSLDRAQQTAIQNGDIAGQLQIQKSKAELDATAQAAQNTFNDAQRIATQSWQTGERIGTEDAAKAAQYYDWQQKNYQQQADFNNQTAQAVLGENLQETMANVNAQIAEAKAANDATRTKGLNAFSEWLTEQSQNNASMNTMDQMTLQGTIQKNLAEQANINNVYLETMKENNALAMQTQDMDQQTKMAYINDSLLTAQKNGDVDRQKQIIGFTTTQTLETMAAQGNIQEGLDQVQGDIQSALSSQNYVQADALQTSAQIFKAQEDAKTNALTQQGIDLQNLGFDYNAVQEAVANGQIDSKAAAALVQHAVQDLGVTVQPADPNQTATKTLQAISTQQLQYASTNPDKVNPAYLTNGAVDPTKIPKNTDGTYDLSKLLTTQGQTDYYDTVNKTLFGATSTTAGTNAGNAVTYDPMPGTGGTNAGFGVTPPAQGSTFKIGSMTYTRTNSDVQKYKGNQAFSATDSNGQQVQVVAAMGIIHPGAVIWDSGDMDPATWQKVNDVYKAWLAEPNHATPGGVTDINQELAKAGITGVDPSKIRTIN